jgi:hypothetical protein
MTMREVFILMNHKPFPQVKSFPHDEVWITQPTKCHVLIML